MQIFCINPQYRLDLPQKYAFFTQINKENNVESTVTQGMPITTTTTFIIYILFMLGVGLYAAKFTRNLSDFILGGRRLGSFVTGLSASAFREWGCLTGLLADNCILLGFVMCRGDVNALFLLMQ